MEHEDFMEKFFVADNEQGICKALEVDNLEEAVGIFEDTRYGWQVDEMLAALVPVTKVQYFWSDEEEKYFTKNG